MNRNLTILLTACLTLSFVLGFGLVFPAFGRTSSTVPGFTHTLSVTGQGFIDIPKTTAQVQLGVEVQGDPMEEDQSNRAVVVQQEVAKRSSAVVKLLQKNTAVTKLDTTGVTLTPTYSYKDNQQKLTGYNGTNIVRFQIEPTAIGTLLDEAVKAGATRIDGVTLVASDQAIAAAEDKAIAQATQQAQRQAAAALGPLQLKQQDVLRIQINQAPAPELAMFDPMRMAPTASLAAAIPVGAAPVVAGEQRVQATVTLQIRY